MFERYTERARRVLFFARYEASLREEGVFHVAYSQPSPRGLEFKRCPPWIVNGSL